MMTTKQRAELRAAANAVTACYYVGKGGIDGAVTSGIREALKARELIKVGVQEACPLTAREAAGELAADLGAEVVQVIGRKFVLYKRNRDIDKYGV